MYEITQDELRALINYDAQTGQFTRKNGRVAGGVRVDGRIEITLKRVTYRADRLAYFYVHGVWAWAIEHKDGNIKNNAIDNLILLERPTPKEKPPRKERTYYNKTGLRGVAVVKDARGETLYMARIYDGKRILRPDNCTSNNSVFLGRFKTAQEAHDAYNEALLKLSR